MRLAWVPVPALVHFARLQRAADHLSQLVMRASPPRPAAASEESGLPRVVSVQNAYSLLCRTFDAGLAECCHMERVALLAYSPLAMGLLTVRQFLSFQGFLGAEGGMTRERGGRTFVGIPALEGG